MIDCDFYKLEANRWKCRNCGRRIKSSQTDPSRIHVNCSKGKPTKPTTCVHLGQQTQTLKGGCKSCGGRLIDVDVFACKLHDECTTKHKVGNMPNYQTCTDYDKNVLTEVKKED